MLVTVTAVVTILLTASLWLTSHRFKLQIHHNAADQLRTAEGVLKVSQQTRIAELLLRFKSAKNEPRFKAATAGLLGDQNALLTVEGQKTFKGVLESLIQEGVADVIVLAPGMDLEHAVAVARESRFDAGKFESGCAASVKRAFANGPQFDRVVNGGRLLDIVTIPINVGEDVVGAITFGVVNSMTQEFKQMMRKDEDLVLLLEGEVVGSTLQESSPSALSKKHAAMLESSQSGGDIQEIEIGEEHFWGLAGVLENMDGSRPLSYLVLSSYETSLLILRSTQQTILLTGLLTILAGVVAVWFLVRKITEPLNELHDSAEAVGQGDFSRRVKVTTRDEFGELARAFNQMTENIELSQSELKQALETIKATQAQLIQKEKLSAVGEFVAGVAHELNNPLTTVMGFSELLQGASLDPKHHRHVGLIFKSAQRCQRIVQSLLSFARQQAPERKPVGINKLIEEVLDVVAYPLRTSNVEVSTQFGTNLPPVLADGHQIQQVVLNIINNARQAIEAHQPSGHISITTKSDSQTVFIILKDNGPGISAENLQRIFNPFFTTKEVGKGTGLGLSLCYGIIKEHGGNITPTSRPGEGATFTIELPCLQITGETTEATDGGQSLVHDPLEGIGRRILVIDDEEDILQMLKERLSQSGYGVDTASDGEEALYQLQQQSYDVTLCDWRMPGLNGRQIYGRLHDISPDSCRRFVFISGDVINEQMREFLETEKRPCLAKPLIFEDVHSAIRTVISE